MTGSHHFETRKRKNIGEKTPLLFPRCLGACALAAGRWGFRGLPGIQNAGLGYENDMCWKDQHLTERHDG